MRIVSASAVILSAFALSACAGGSMTGNALSAMDSLPCSLDQVCPTPTPPGPTPPPVVTPPGTTPPNTGNTTNLATGDKTIALESAVLVSPLTGALSTLTRTAGPNTARMQIDTNAASNGNWPIPKVMEEDVFGTNASGGVGLGGTYKEYRYLSADASGTLTDEELQVWDWGSSYGTQYRDIAGAGDARRQAWSFGGTATPAATITAATGSVTYTGAYGATAKTWNWVDPPVAPPGKTLSANNTWQIEGTSSLTANFTADTLTGTLTPGTWTAEQTLNSATGPATVNAGNIANPNWIAYMNDQVVLTGTITGNTVSGKAQLDPSLGWFSGVNPMYAGFFGAGNNITGIYTFVAAVPTPRGGQVPHNNDRRGYVEQSGVFHSTCVSGVGGCP